MENKEYYQITLEPKGGNSPIRFFLMQNSKKIGMAKRANSRSWKKDFWIVDVYKKECMKDISNYMHNIQGIERFYWGYLTESNSLV